MAEYRTPPESMKDTLDALYARLDPLYLDPGFRVTGVSIWKEPKKTLLPAIWRGPTGGRRCRSWRKWSAPTMPSGAT